MPSIAALQLHQTGLSPGMHDIGAPELTICGQTRRSRPCARRLVDSGMRFQLIYLKAGSDFDLTLNKREVQNGRSRS